MTLDLYHKFCNELRKQRKKLSVIALLGNSEDYLVKEFAYFLCRVKPKKQFVLLNCGNNRENKIDMCLVRGKGKVKDDTIYEMIEAKYITNWARGNPKARTDVITTSLKRLKEQLEYRSEIKHEHGGKSVKLRARTKQIYGLVFAAYVNNKDPFLKKDFYDKIKKKAKENDLIYYDLKTPQLDTIFEDFLVESPNSKCHVTLKVGLWRLQPA